ncbi:galactose-1-phosphate uridylyltransferase [Thermodesulfobacteriota bacterium]
MTWEQRWHPLREEWIIVAAHRQNRPWIGETIGKNSKQVPEYDPGCFLCPGNKRVSGLQNPEYKQTFVFDNDHACVSWDAPEVEEAGEGIYKRKPARGVARVICYSPRHDLTLTELEPDEIVVLLKEWQRQYIELGKHPEINHILLFENKGEAVGVSNPHPHCQLYATNFVFKYIETEARVSSAYFKKTKRILFQDILKAEKEDGQRVIFENDSAIVFMPYFARYAYEVYVAPKESYLSVADLSENELKDFSEALKHILIKFDNLWQIPFPYVMPLHQAPTDGKDHSGFHFHIEFHPPLRKPNLLKYLAGPEIGGGNFLSDTAPEEKAEELRNLPDIHYKKTGNKNG